MKIKGIELLTYDIPKRLNSIIPKNVRKKVSVTISFILIFSFFVFEKFPFLTSASNSIKYFSDYISSCNIHKFFCFTVLMTFIKTRLYVSLTLSR